MMDKAQEAIEKYNMLSIRDSVIAAVSGGADSMALLSFFLEIRQKWELSITVCHVNHGLRGQEAVRDQTFVQEFCSHHGIPFRLFHADVQELAKRRRLSLEECGREVRYEFFEQVSKELGGAKIATAHTLSDSMETVLFNLSRGTSTAGLCGIPPVRDNIIRPLILCTRQQIEVYLQQRGITFVTDSTNLACDYTRNRIRHQLIPLFYQLNPAFDAAVERMTDELRDVDHFLTASAKSRSPSQNLSCGIETDIILRENKAVASRIIMMFLRENKLDCSYSRVGEILKAAKDGTGRISVGKDRYVRIKDNRIMIETTSVMENIFYEYPLSPGKFYLFGQLSIEINLLDYTEYQNLKKVIPNLLNNCLDYDKIDNNAVIRQRRQGDYIRLNGRKVTKTLKKLFNEANISVENRCKIPIIACGSHVAWVYSVGVDQSFCTDDNSERILYLKLSEDFNDL